MFLPTRTPLIPTTEPIVDWFDVFAHTDDTTTDERTSMFIDWFYLFTLETMPVRSVQRADIHEAYLLQSGTALFLVRAFVFHDTHSRSNISLALIKKQR